MWHFSAAAGCFPVCSLLWRLSTVCLRLLLQKQGQEKLLLGAIYTKWPPSQRTYFLHLFVFLQHPESCSLCHQQLVWSLKQFFLKQWHEIILRANHCCVSFLKIRLKEQEKSLSCSSLLLFLVSIFNEYVILFLASPDGLVKLVFQADGCSALIRWLL